MLLSGSFAVKETEKCINAEGAYEAKVFMKVEDLKAGLFTDGNDPGERRRIDGGGERDS